MAAEPQTTETQAPATTPVPVPSSVPANPPPQQTSNQRKVEYQKIFSEATKYTIFVVFTLYAIGFVIWHSYLAGYGISSVQFLQTEYLAAAFCYLFVLTAFAVPPALLFQHWFSHRAKDLPDNRFFVTMVIWLYLSNLLSGLMFPAANHRHWHKLAVTCIAVAGVLNLTAYLVAAVKWKNSRFFKLMKGFDFFSIYILAFVVSNLASNEEIQPAYLRSTLFLYTSVSFVAVEHIRTYWAKGHLLLRVLLVSFVCMTVIANVRSFADLQFGRIPRQFGGGRPETAYLKFPPQRNDVAAALNIPPATNSFASNGLFGPVAILLRSEKEMLLVDYAALHAPATLTNLSTSLRTNLIRHVTTNLAGLSATNGASMSIASNQSCYAFVTNVTTNVDEVVKVTTVKNVQEVTGKHVRADLIDAVIFVQ
jgi:hypothetical protein